MLAVSMQRVKARLAANRRGSFPAKLSQDFALGRRALVTKA